MKKHTKFIAAMLLTIGMFVFSPLFSLPASADVSCGSGMVQTNTGLCLPASAVGNAYGGGTVNGLIVTIINFMLSIAATIAILFIVWGGFQYITSAGNSEKAESGRNTLVNALIGLTIVIMAFVIVGIVNSTVSSCLSSGGILGCL